MPTQSRAYTAQYGRDPNMSRPLTAAPTSDFGSSVLDALTSAVGGFTQIRENQAQNRLRGSQSALFDAQAREATLKGDNLRREQVARDDMASFFAGLKDNPDLANAAGSVLAELTARGAIDPKATAGIANLFYANTELPNSEDRLIRNNVAAGGPYTESDEAATAPSRDRLFNQKDATTRYGFDTQASAQRDVARTQAGATVRSAEIKAGADERIAQTTNTTAMAAPKYTPEDLAIAVSQAVPQGASRDVKNAVSRRTEELVQGGATLQSAAGQAAAELVDKGAPSGGFLGVFQTPATPTVRATPAEAPPTARAVPRAGSTRQVVRQPGTPPEQGATRVERGPDGKLRIVR